MIPITPMMEARLPDTVSSTGDNCTASGPDGVYRIREARVSCAARHGFVIRRMFLAERRRRILGLFSIWLSVTNGQWRDTAAEAAWDAQEDLKLQAPLAPPTFFSPTKG
jgi:hypothetical protein